MNKLYLFDFDGTLTKKDSLFDFLYYSFPKKYKFAFIKYIPLFLLVKFGFLQADKIKEQFISHFLKGRKKEEIKYLSTKYFEYSHKDLLRENALKYIKNLDNIPDKYLVTASLDIWVKPFADFLGLRLISTEAEFINDIFTGKFSTPNCNNLEKRNRIIKEVQLTKFTKIYAFGDSKGDKEMLKLATHSYLNFFK